MKIFLSYKQTWVDSDILSFELWLIREFLNELWHEVYIYFLDEEEEDTPTDIILKVKHQIKKADLVIWYINYPEKSEWELIELWIAEALNKKILLLINEKCRENYTLIHWLGSESLYYNHINDLDILFSQYFTWK